MLGSTRSPWASALHLRRARLRRHRPTDWRLAERAAAETTTRFGKENTLGGSGSGILSGFRADGFGQTFRDTSLTAACLRRQRARAGSDGPTVPISRSSGRSNAPHFVALVYSSGVAGSDDLRVANRLEQFQIPRSDRGR